MHLNKRHPWKKQHFVTTVSHHSLHSPHGLLSLMAFTPRHGLAKKCWFNLSLFPHNFSQHWHLYLGWHLPLNNVDYNFNNPLISTTFCAHSSREYQNKNHVGNIVLPFSLSCTSWHHHNIPPFSSGGVNSQGPWAIDDHYYGSQSEFLVKHGYGWLKTMLKLNEMKERMLQTKELKKKYKQKSRRQQNTHSKKYVAKKMQ